MSANGRHARVYWTGSITEPDLWMPVTYHRAIRGRNRQLTLSPKLIRKMQRTSP